KRFKDIKLIIIIFIILYFLLGPLGLPSNENFTAFKEIMFGYYVIGILFIILVIIFNAKTLKEDLVDYFSNFKHSIWQTLKYLFLSLIIYSLFRGLASFLIEMDPSGHNLIVATFETFPLYVIFITLIYTPFVEEVILRKMIHTLVSHKYLFIFISSSIYALLHVWGDYTSVIEFITLFLPFISSGIVIAYSYYKTRNIYIPIFIHLIYNLIAFIQLL
ncbi:MAG: CPBP family intramembrane metalloprotease, partial [Bacilli bacterium]|nr:CPBP family intramembrane metalloprotease [Bacilli bacterium]